METCHEESLKEISHGGEGERRKMFQMKAENAALVHKVPEIESVKKKLLYKICSRILFLRGASCCVKLLQFLYMLPIVTEMFFYLITIFTTTCFGPYGPSSVQQNISVPEMPNI
jgi:hypothetical protein